MHNFNGFNIVSLDRVRKALLALFALSSFGLLVELYLLGHMEDYWQLLPIVLLLLTLLIGLLELFFSGVVRLIWIRIVCLTMMASSILGIGLHFNGNRAFELEMYPDMVGWELFGKTITGATPALSPAAMFVIGGLGWIYTMLSLRENKKESKY